MYFELGTHNTITSLTSVQLKFCIFVVFFFTTSVECCIFKELKMSIDLEHIRSRNAIEDLVGERFSLKKSGKRFIGVEHDSLAVIPKTGFYFWHSRGEHGDVFDFVGRYQLGYDHTWNAREPALFIEAVRFLADRVGISIDEDLDLRNSAAWSERQVVTRLRDALLNTPPAWASVTQKRGWNMTTVKAARLGFMPQDKRVLLDGLNLSDMWKAVVNKFPAGMIVYVHLEKGRLTYLSGRSIEGKKHFNPPQEIIGQRRPYFNFYYNADVDYVVVVEGQADAITFAEWGIPAIAIGGMSVDDELLTLLQGHKRVFVMLDNTDSARTLSWEIAAHLGNRAYLPQFPNGVKDANEWLVEHKATAEDAEHLLNTARSWLLSETQRAANLEGLAREDAIRNLFRHVTDMDEFSLAEFKVTMDKIGVKGRAFNELLKAAQTQEVTEEQEDDQPQILGDDVPLLSPALGFQKEIALVTICVMERTHDHRLYIQPYLVTSKRELRRLDDKQIIQVNGHEVALRVIPEGCEFLMRWRFGDIQRFLKGESVEPGEVFQTIHNLFTHHVDFKSPVESRILTLWAIGTYFYTMFPAYPYLALNGPKNSGKSTVLRVLQPIAFNMVNTSDPSGASMFRLIHYTSCTVGIDEAERYHNPRDIGMQQIRQLLNSGYKQGMPALRITGEDMKPQAFDVYSPKILAAIAGLEDILASRCIAIPMRRTDRKMPAFPPDLDGASLRHQLYTLALTYFPQVYRNYFERPELHTLTNRSGELWSPLVALAAFFEEQGQVTGLRETITEAAASDAQLSEGKALSDREEAVLQALELLLRDQQERAWVKAAGLREQVGRLLGQSAERMGDAQWIGHILKRLHLIDDGRRKRNAEGMTYAIDPQSVLDMMRRYDVPRIDDSTS
jgi:hypothetical protein